MDIRISSLFDLTKTIASELFSGHEYPWEVLAYIKEFTIKLGESLPSDKYTLAGENIWVANDAKIAPSASISGPCIIDSGTEVRQCAYIRGSAVIGKNCVIGNSCEVKNSVIFDNVQVPHFNYIGDSILGYKSHLGAGAVTSNVKSDKTNVVIKYDGLSVPTERKKVGAMVGDYVEVGCNSVLCPGCIIGRNTNIYPLSRVRGGIPAVSIYKGDGKIIAKK